MFDIIIEAKHIELVELQLKYLIKNIKLINKLIIIVNSKDPTLDFKLKILKHQINLDIEFIPYSKIANKNTFEFLNNNFNQNKNYLFVSGYISYFENNFLNSLSKEIESDKSYIYFPQILNTERVFYIHQIMGLHKSYTNGRWSNDYIDSELLLDFNNWDKDVLLKINKKYITIIKLNILERLKFNKYYFLTNELLPLYCFTWNGTLLKNNNFQNSQKVMLGNCICSLFCRDSLEFENYKTSGLIQRYSECLSIPKEESYKQLEFDYEYKREQLIFDFDVDEEISLENKLKKLFNSISNKTIEIKFVINTYINQNKYIYDKLINGLISNNIDPKNIYLVIGGSTEEKTEIIHSVNYHYVKHNSFDHTGLIDIIDKGLQSDFWFIMHDTCSVGPNFYTKLLKKSFLDHNPLLEEGWLNMGVFSNKFIYENKKYILSLRNCDKMQAILSEKMYPRLASSFHLNSKKDYDLQTTFDVYGDGIERSVVYFPEVDLYKYQTYYHNSEISIALFESRKLTKDINL